MDRDDIAIYNSIPTAEGAESVKEESLLVMAEQDPLWQEISSKAPDYEMKPIDARIDRVWKAVPGYNGLKVWH